jgi:hypothetical protein
VPTISTQIVPAKVSDQSVPVELDEMKQDYPHPMAGSDAGKIGVGLFMKPTE